MSTIDRFGRVAALLGAFLAFGTVAYHAYLASPEVPSGAPVAAGHAPLARRAVLFIIDGFNPRRAFEPAVMPTFNRLAAAGAAGMVTTGPITTTAPCIFSLTTGRPGSLMQAILNFHSRETRVDSLLSLTVQAGGKVVVAGDPAWKKQFGWLVPEADHYVAAEPGVGTDERIVRHDREAIDFLLERVKDPAYRLAVVHLGSVDAIGHVVTPLGEGYAQRLTDVDALLARTVSAFDLHDTVVLVTGDHGMAARGTHGGEEEARHTPFVLVGAGVRAGTSSDVAQTALTSTLGALLGLPFLPVSEYPPATELLAIDAGDAAALRAKYLAVKLAAVPGSVPIRLGLGDPGLNGRLNEAFFGGVDARYGQRLAALLLGLAGLFVAVLLAWRSMPWRADGGPVAVLGWSAALMVGLWAAAAGMIATRDGLRFPSEVIAMGIAGGLLVVVAGVAWAALHSTWLRRQAQRLPAVVFVAGCVALSVPLVNSHWLRPNGFFAVLLFGVAAGLAVLHAPAVPATLRGASVLPLAAVAVFDYGLSGPDAAMFEAGGLEVLSLVFLAIAARLLWPTGERWARLGALLLAAAFAVGAWWRADPVVWKAQLVFGLVLALLAAGAASRDRQRGTPVLLIGGVAAAFLVLASEGHEVVVLLLASIAGLILTTFDIDLEEPFALYGAAAVALLVRLVLFFELGDQYNLSSIRTAPGFVLVDQGLPLGRVVSVLLVKYALPWVLILAVLLPALERAGRRQGRHFLDLLSVGYAARFALVAAVIDPCRALPNGMDGIVGLFCVSWAEFATFGLAAMLVTDRKSVV